MAILATFLKQPSDVLDYDIDCTDWLVTSDDISTIASAVSPAGLTIGSTVNNDPIVKTWLSGGTHGTTYTLTITITTSAGRVKEVEFRVRVVET